MQYSGLFGHYGVVFCVQDTASGMDKIDVQDTYSHYEAQHAWSICYRL